MKIQSVETICLSRMHEPERQWFTKRELVVKADCAIVVIHTDDGLTGIGEASAYGVPPRISEVVLSLQEELVGRSPLAVLGSLRARGREGTYVNSHDAAVAGLDAALWDLRGQIEGKRVSELLAARPLEKVRLYASSGCRYDWGTRPEQLLEEAQGYMAAGFTAHKVRLGNDWREHGVTVDRFIGLMRELRQTVGTQMELMVDGNQRLSEEEALPIALALDELGFTWFEEPIDQENIDGYARLSASVQMPISGGEQLTTLEEFLPYLEKKAYDIIQPDAGVCPISELMRIAQVAYEKYRVDLCPHNWHNGLMTMANAHVVAALPHPRLLELNMLQGPLQWAIINAQPPIHDGWLTLPERPGLGVTLADGLVERWPYQEGDYFILP